MQAALQSVEDETDQAAAQVLALYPCVVAWVTHPRCYICCHVIETAWHHVEKVLCCIDVLSKLLQNWHDIQVPSERCNSRALRMRVQALQLETEAELAEFSADPAPKPLDPEAEEDDNDAEDTRHASQHLSNIPACWPRPMACLRLVQQALWDTVLLRL